MYVPVHVCLCVQRPEVNISHLPPFLFIFEIGSLTELVAQKFTYTDYPSKFIDLSVFIHPLPPTWELQGFITNPSIFMDAKDLNSFPQSYPTSTLSSESSLWGPYRHLFNK